VDFPLRLAAAPPNGVGRPATRGKSWASACTTARAITANPGSQRPPFAPEHRRRTVADAGRTFRRNDGKHRGTAELRGPQGEVRSKFPGYQVPRSHEAVGGKVPPTRRSVRRLLPGKEQV